MRKPPIQTREVDSLLPSRGHTNAHHCNVAVTGLQAIHEVGEIRSDVTQTDTQIRSQGLSHLDVNALKLARAGVLKADAEVLGPVSHSQLAPLFDRC